MSKIHLENKLEKYLRDILVSGMVSAHQDIHIVEKWKDFIKTLKISEDPFKMSKNKYKARLYYVGVKYKILINLNAFAKLFKINVLNMFKTEHTSEEYVAKDAGKQDMVIQVKTDIPEDDIMPEELYKEFSKHVSVPVSFKRTRIFNKELKKIYKKLCRKNPFSFNYQLLALKELAWHSYVLENYDPKAVVVYANERNLFSPILKDFYEKNNKEFISFMHGTDLFHLIKVFSSFSRYYVWDEDYIQMYKNELFYNINQYIVYSPKKNNYSFEEKSHYEKDITYYISGHTDETHKKIVELIKILKEKNINLTVRPHPRREFDLNIYNKDDLEDLSVDIVDSMDNTEYILGVATTVVEQGFFAGKKILIDDEEFYLLKTRKFLMLSKINNNQVMLLSDYLRGRGIEPKDLFNENTTT